MVFAAGSIMESISSGASKLILCRNFGGELLFVTITVNKTAFV